MPPSVWACLSLSLMFTPAHVHLLGSIGALRVCLVCVAARPGFWQGWHCSFHAWLVRYIYVPLGGSRHGYWCVAALFCCGCRMVHAPHTCIREERAHAHRPLSQCAEVAGVTVVPEAVLWRPFHHHHHPLPPHDFGSAAFPPSPPSKPIHQSIRWQALASGVVFVFVAAWHDMNVSLLTWGCLFALVIVPEKALYQVIARVRSPRCVPGLVEQKYNGPASPTGPASQSESGKLKLPLNAALKSVRLRAGAG